MLASSHSDANEAQQLYVENIARHNGKANSVVFRSLAGSLSNLKVLSLYSTYIGDAGTVSLSYSLPLLPKLTVLDLRANGISNAACPVLCEQLKRVHTLKVLDVSYNKLITRQGGKDLLGLICANGSIIHIGVARTMVSRYYETRIAAHGRRRLELQNSATQKKWKTYLASLATEVVSSGDAAQAGEDEGEDDKNMDDAAKTVPADSIKCTEAASPTRPLIPEPPGGSSLLDYVSPDTIPVRESSSSNHVKTWHKSARPLATRTDHPTQDPPTTFQPTPPKPKTNAPSPAPPKRSNPPHTESPEEPKESTEPNDNLNRPIELPLNCPHAPPKPKSCSSTDSGACPRIDSPGIEALTCLHVGDKDTSDKSVFASIPPPYEPSGETMKQSTPCHHKPSSGGDEKEKDPKHDKLPQPPHNSTASSHMSEKNSADDLKPKPPATQPPPRFSRLQSKPSTTTKPHRPTPYLPTSQVCDISSEAALLRLVDAYTPKHIEILTRFKYPGSLNYLPAVGAPEPCLTPTCPSELPPLKPGCTPQSDSLFWSFLSTAASAKKGKEPMKNPNLPENTAAALDKLRTDIYYANIAPPAALTPSNGQNISQVPEPVQQQQSPPEQQDQDQQAQTESPHGQTVQEKATLETPDSSSLSKTKLADQDATIPSSHSDQAENSMHDHHYTVDSTQRREAPQESEATSLECEAAPSRQLCVRPCPDGLVYASDFRCLNIHVSRTTALISSDASTNLARICRFGHFPSPVPNIAKSLPICSTKFTVPADTASVLDMQAMPSLEPRAEPDSNTNSILSSPRVLLCEGEDRISLADLSPTQREAFAVQTYLARTCLSINLIEPVPVGTLPEEVQEEGYYLHEVVKPALDNGVPIRGARLTSGALDDTGRKLATGSYDKTAKIWDGKTGQLMHTLQGHDGYVYDAVWNSPFCDRVITAAFDNTCRVWNALTGESLHTLAGHDLEVVCVSVNRASTLIASGSIDQSVIIWNALTGSQVAVLHGHRGDILCVCFSPAKDWVASSSADGTVRLWNALTGECLAVFEGHMGEVGSVKFNVHGNLVLSGSLDSTCRLWDVHTKKGKVLKGHSRDVSDCTFSDDGWLVASSSEDMSARVWDALSAGCISMMKGHQSGLSCVSFGAGDTELLTGSADMTCRRWKVSTGECLQVLHGHQGVVISTYCADWSVILTISKDNSCRIWRKDPPDTLVETLLRYICMRPYLKAQVYTNEDVPSHIKKRLTNMHSKFIDFTTPESSPAPSLASSDSWLEMNTNLYTPTE
ncbi:putative WD40 repeat-containing protein [Diplonema papillatum]|nr:putative WD40 repeat-containing protein [Diplonema papillatum]